MEEQAGVRENGLGRPPEVYTGRMIVPLALTLALQEVFRPPCAIVDYRTRDLGSGPRTEVALRVVLYSVAWEFPLNFAFEKGESNPKNGRGTERSRLIEALANAVTIGAHKLDAPSPRVRVKQTGWVVMIDGGARVLLLREMIETARGHVIRCGPDEAEIAMEGRMGTLAEGDTVRQAMEPISLSHACESVFDTPRNSGMGGGHRGPGVR